MLLALVVGAGLSWVLGHMIRDELAFERAAQAAEGHVVALRERRSNGKFHTTVYAPVFRFTTADGRTVDAVAADGSDPPAWSIGETGRLLYDPADPLHAVVDSAWGRWSASSMLALVTLSFFAAGLLGLRTRAWRLL